MGAVEMPQLTPVNSSNLRAVGYLVGTATLWVEFQNGHLYRYPNVPVGAHRALMSAASMGSYFTRRIKPVYQGQRMR
jgi:lysyl-tRNA synthetase class 2